MNEKDRLVTEKHHEEHQDWMQKLNFYQDEVRIFQNELSKVIQQHPNLMSILEHVDEYRRILLRKLEHIDEFRHAIAMHESKLVLEKGMEPNAFITHNSLRRELEHFVEDMEQFKHMFRMFVAHNN